MTNPTDAARNTAAIAADARHLTRASARAALATTRRADGWPYASLVTVAADMNGAPLLLLSDLAEHSAHIAADDRISLLFEASDGIDNPQTAARATILGRARRSDVGGDRDRFLARHRKATAYAGFTDFKLYRVTVEKVRWVGGFGEACWLDGADFLYPGPTEALAHGESALLDEINADHGHVLAALAAQNGDAGQGPWRITGVDPEGCDLRCGARRIRLIFAKAALNAPDVREMLAKMAAAEQNGATPG